MEKVKAIFKKGGTGPGPKPGAPVTHQEQGASRGSSSELRPIANNDRSNSPARSPWRAPLFPDGVAVWHDCPDATVDICFVHGLTGNRDSTWTADRQFEPWPKTLLPPRLPRARLLTYGYDAYVVRKSATSANRLVDHAANLLTDLTNERASHNASSRRLVFVAHSLGGLVCKEAILLSRNNPEAHLRGIFDCVVGVVFMGTPHRGSWMADWAKIPASALGLLKSTNKSLLAILETHNQLLESGQARFWSMVREVREGGRPLEVTCFFEELPLPAVGRVVSKESATLEGYTAVSVHADHRNMVRFGSADDNGFKRLFGELIRWHGLANPAPSSQQAVGGTIPHSVLSRRTCSHWVVPFGRNESFVGRESILQQLLKRIPPGANKDDCQRTAIEGLGGVGKTQIALEAAFRLRDKHPDCSVFWAPTVDAGTFENAYREIGRSIGVAGIDEDKADVKVLVKAALSREEVGRWLLVVDNADDTDILFGPAGLSNHLPFSRTGSILFTTRNHEAVVRLDIPERGVISAREMSRDEALELLYRGLKENQTRDAASAAGLLDFLADLPLAIKQASAYMARTGTTTARYLDHCRSSDKTMIKLLSRDFEDRSRYGCIGNAVATTWLISFEHIARNALAAQYLRSMCFLSEKEIPRVLLPPADDELEADEAIGTLKAYAFITQREGQDSFDVHRLVRLVMRNWLEEKGQLQEYRASVLQRLAAAFPFPEHENREVWMGYLPHAQTALECGGDATEREIDLLFKMAESYSILGRYQVAEAIYRQLLKLQEQVLGEEHPDTLCSMNNLAIVLSDLGKYEEAEAIHRQEWKLTKKVLGEEHPDTFTSMNNLAEVLRRQGKYEEAEAIHRQTLGLKEKMLGKKHPDTLASMMNIAIMLDSLGKYEEAEAIHRQTLVLKLEVLGKEHPDTLSSMNNLAHVLGNLGKYEEGEAIHRQTLKLREELLSEEHPDILLSMNNLAEALRHQGKYEEAKAIHQQTLVLRQKVLGEEHPDTLASMNNLALVFEKLGKYQEAEAIHRQTLGLKKKVLGEKHPDTLISIMNVANALDNLGNYEEAEAMHRQTLVLRQKVIGEEHPDTLASMNNLAVVLENLGKYEEAEAIHRQTLRLKQKVLGEKHPSTLHSIMNAAHVLSSLGKYEEAEAIYRRALEGYVTVLGEESPYTLVRIRVLLLPAKDPPFVGLPTRPDLTRAATVT
ncbi:hypothetical protein DL765_009639 [Monosporascus sp. GIB2]|nr:hypothetical protein DL765_009639 [Monosporascus sp. GIB2]